MTSHMCWYTQGLQGPYFFCGMAQCVASVLYGMLPHREPHLVLKHFSRKKNHINRLVAEWWRRTPPILAFVFQRQGAIISKSYTTANRSTDFTPPLAVKKIPLLSPGNPGLLYVADTAGDWAASWKFMKWGNCLQFLCWFFHVSRLAMQLEPALQCYKKNVAILDYYLKTFHDVRASSWS